MKPNFQNYHHQSWWWWSSSKMVLGNINAKLGHTLGYRNRQAWVLNLFLIQKTLLLSNIRKKKERKKEKTLCNDYKIITKRSGTHMNLSLSLSFLSFSHRSHCLPQLCSCFIHWLGLSSSHMKAFYVFIIIIFFQLPALRFLLRSPQEVKNVPFPS